MDAAFGTKKTGLDWTEIMEKTISMIYASKAYRNYLKQRKNPEVEDINHFLKHGEWMDRWEEKRRLRQRGWYLKKKLQGWKRKNNRWYLPTYEN